MGQHIGAGNITAAKQSIVVACGLISTAAITVSCLVWHYQHAIAVFYTRDQEAQKLILAAIPALCASLVVRSWSALGSFALSGMSRNAEVAAIQAISQWLVLVPMAYYLGFVHDGLCSGFVGIMWASPIGHGFKTVLNLTLLATTHWQSEVEKTQLRQETPH